jgi:hypothetical protein
MNKYKEEILSTGPPNSLIIIVLKISSHSKFLKIV